MGIRSMVASLAWGALIGASIGCLAGLAEFAAIFASSDGSYTGSFALAYRHVVYPFAILGILAGAASAAMAIALALARSQKGLLVSRVRVSTISLLVALFALAYVLIGLRLAKWAPKGLLSNGLLLIFCIGVVGVASFTLHSWLLRSSAKGRWGLGKLIPGSLVAAAWMTLFVLVVTLVPPVVLGERTTSAAGTMINSPTDRPNVIFILVDTLRADHLSMYGYSRVTSPSLENLAKSAITFTQASAASSWTKPSVASIFSGLYPVAHKARTNQDFLSGSVLTLAEALRDSGYLTMGVTANPLIAPTFGFTQGFIDFSAPETVSPFRFTSIGRVARSLSNQLRVAESKDREAQSDDAATGQGGTGVRVGPSESERSELGRSLRSVIRRSTNRIAEIAFGEKIGTLPPGDGITDIALSMARRSSRARPVFLYVHYIDPHVPYSPPPPYDRAFSHQDDIPIRESGVDALSIGASEDDREWIGTSVDLYDGEILFVDTQIGRLLDGLEEMGLLENSLVVLTSDHGEEFLDHGGTKHGRTLYEEVLRVPLLIRMPDLSSAGRTFDRPVGLVDLMPTVLELAGAEQPQSIHGRSLVADLSSGGGEQQPTRYFGQVLHLEMARVDDLKIIRNRNQQGSEEIYDLGADPLERVNLADLHSDEMQELLGLFEELDEDAIALGPGIQQQDVAEEDEALEALRALGYIE